MVDGKTLCTNTKTPNGLLYTCPWEPKDFRVGLHKMEIFVEVNNHFAFNAADYNDRQ